MLNYKAATRKYWLGVASENHVQIGVEGGFCQLNHGKKTALMKMKANDIIIYYAPKWKLGEKEACQKFVAIGRLLDDEIYQVEMHADFYPYRRNVEYIKDVSYVSIHKLKEQLQFTENAKHYGEKLRYGHLEISKEDCLLIWKYLKNS